MSSHSTLIITVSLVLMLSPSIAQCKLPYSIPVPDSGPVLLEMQVVVTMKNQAASVSQPQASQLDPLLHCQRYLEEHSIWDEAWVTQLRERITEEVEQAVQDALRDA